MNRQIRYHQVASQHFARDGTRLSQTGLNVIAKSGHRGMHMGPRQITTIEFASVQTEYFLRPRSIIIFFLWSRMEFTLRAK